MVRLFLLLAALSAMFADVAHAQQNGFDLDGPEVAISVRRGMPSCRSRRCPRCVAATG
ncbi:hypothetical protein [Sphingomonas hankookensis]|uniref:hypothetical protein n=1 Tax=Sphingomonas hankookensis TaxID=563996 RepID=UPI003D3021E6